MTTLVNSAVGKAGPVDFAELVDRWLYVFMAGLFLIVVLVGFIPDSINKIATVRTGERPPFPAILHVHAVLMGSWIALLVAQTTLMATNRPALHKQLGMLALFLAPALVIVGFILVPTMRAETANAILHGSPGVVASLKPRFEFTLNIMLVQIRIGILFGVFVALGLWARRTDSSLHKRMMIIGTAVALPPALDRMLWLPSSLPENPLTTDLYPLVLLGPMFFWDLYRLRKVHVAYVIYLVVGSVAAVPVYLLWHTSVWRETALRILGISGI